MPQRSTDARTHRAHKVIAYTYGSLRCGNAAFANDFNRLVSDSWRIANDHDIAPHVPPWPLGYRHVHHAALLSPGGGVSLPDAGYLRIGPQGKLTSLHQVRASDKCCVLELLFVNCALAVVDR
jgi:Lipase (class 3)